MNNKKKKNIYLYSCILLLLFLISGCAKQSIEQKEGIDKKTKCEQSGGIWDAIVCNMPGCEPIFYCNCETKRDARYEGDILKKDIEFLLRNNNSCDTCNDFCIPCKQDSDCGKNNCRT